MKLPHLLRVEAGAERFAPLIAAARDAGLRVGWLDLDSTAAAPPELEVAASLGVLRAVAAGPRRTIAVKPRRGTPVVKDLLREHFIGCGLVLVRGGEGLEAATLRPAAMGAASRAVGAAASDVEADTRDVGAEAGEVGEEASELKQEMGEAGARAGAGEGVWEIELPREAPRRYATGELVAALRRPRPFLRP
jgi:hypothetical protein